MLPSAQEERHGQDERRRPAGGYERQYRELAAQIADVGIIASGSVTRRYTRCTSPGCRCNADPPAPHGPYWQWTRK